jgi:TolB-like protein
MKKLIPVVLVLLSIIICLHAQTKIAISSFENKSDDFKLDRWETLVPGILRSELADNAAFVILERENLDELFEEYKLSLSGLADSNATLELGQLSGADYLISGTIHTLGEKYWIDVNITDVKNAEMSLEQVTAYDTEHVRQMVELLAGNIQYRLGVSDAYQEKIELTKYPTGYFLLATAGLGTATVLYHQKFENDYDKYHNTDDLREYDKYYDSANQAKKIRDITVSLGIIALTGTIYCWVRNKSIHDIVAFSEKKKKIIPQIEIDEKGVSSVGFKIFF